MHHHVVAFRFNPGVSDGDIAQLADELRFFASQLEGLVSYACGADLRMREGNDDFAISAVFDSVQALNGYLTHPGHQAIATRYVTAMVAEKHGAQFSASST